MGGTRFTLGALHQILLQKKHTIRVSLMTKSAVSASDMLDTLAAPKGGSLC